MKAEIEVLQPGLFSIIQDRGRFGFRKYGVPASGTMDSYAAKTANLILMNSENDAVLEITQMGPKLRFPQPTKIAISGAEFSPSVNGQPVENNEVLKINAGEELAFGRRKNGCRAYLAVVGGFQTEEVMNSRSWYEGITGNTRLEKGMFLAYEVVEEEVVDTFSGLKFNSDYFLSEEIEAFPGPEYERLTEKQRAQLKEFSFSLDSNNNRMAVQLKEELENELEPIITGPVVPGTVQLTPGGRLIVLMRDCQTTGGYPRVLQLSEVGINGISQKIMGDEVDFRIKE